MQCDGNSDEDDADANADADNHQKHKFHMQITEHNVGGGWFVGPMVMPSHALCPNLFSSVASFHFFPKLKFLKKQLSVLVRSSRFDNIL